MNFLNTINTQNRLENQKTINSKISFSGVGIHNGKAVDMVLYPAPENTGIIFKRVDLPKNNVIKVKFQNVVRSKFCSKLVNEFGVSISTVEHLMSSLYALSIDNLFIEINSPELPAMDGSAYEYTYKILEVGRKVIKTPKKILKIKKQLSANINERWIKISPDDHLSINLDIDYKNTLIGKDHYKYLHNEKNFINDICFSRTFTLLKDVKKLRASGFGIGGNLNNAIVVDNNEIVNTSGLKCKNEFIRHKVLDCLGDLYLSGIQILGKIESFAPGHELNFKILNKIFQSKSNYEILSFVEQNPSEEVNYLGNANFNVA